MNASEIQVLVPDGMGGLAVCGLADLYRQAEDFEALDELLMSCTFDTVDLPRHHPGGWPSCYDPDDVRLLIGHVGRVERLTATGDAEAYWEAPSESPVEPA